MAANFIIECKKYAAYALSMPPSNDWQERWQPSGVLVAQFVLPLNLLRTTNSTGRAGYAGQRWAILRDKRAVRQAMRLQHQPRDEPLPGRPHVRAIRFSSVCPDASSNWAKWAVDVLCCGKHGLRFLRDDRPRDALVRQLWEPAKRGSGFNLIEVWDGKEV